MLDEIQKILTKPKTIRITMNVAGEIEHIHGYAIGLSKSLLVMRWIEEFRVEGYKIVRIKDISEIRRNEYEETYDQILKHFQVPPATQSPKWLKYGNWKSVFNSLQKRKKCVAVNSISLNYDEFALGLVEGTGRGSISIKAFDATAKWFDEPRVFRFQQIYQVGFDDRYHKIFYKYMVES